jgi:hypothetical protein
MEKEQIIFFVGQALGIIAPALGILSYQMKTPKKILLLQLINSLIFCIHYLMIGAITGMTLNFVGVCRNLVFYRRNLRGSKGKLAPIIFTVITAIVGILTWDGWYSIFIFLGIVIHSFCMSFSNAQNIRKSILITSPLVIIYDIFTLSIGGIIYETIAIASCVVGIIRHRENKNVEEK